MPAALLYLYKGIVAGNYILREDMRNVKTLFFETCTHRHRCYAASDKP